MPYYQQILKHNGGIIRQRGDVWQAELHSRGKRKRKTFETVSDAKFWINCRQREIREDGRAGFRLSDKERIEAYAAIKRLKPVPLSVAVDFYMRHFHPAGGTKTVRELYASYLTGKTAIGLRPASLVEIKCRIGCLAADVGDKNIHEVTTETLKDWLDNHKFHPANRRNYITYLIGFFNYAVKQKLIDHNPASDLERPKIDETLPEAFTVPDVEKLFAGAKEKYTTIIPWLAIGFFGGLRTAELKGLKWTDIKLAEKIITVRPEVAKRRRQRHVTISDNLAAWLAPHIKPSGKIAPPDITRRRRLIKLLKETGVKWVANGMRHSFASYHLAAFGDAGRTALELGHAGLPGVLFNHYRGLVKREDAEKYWKIMSKKKAGELPPASLLPKLIL